MAFEVSSVPFIADDGIRPPPLADYVVQLAGDASAGDRGIGDQRQTLPGAVIDYRQDPKAPAIVQLVVNEVQAPTLVSCPRHLERPPHSKRPLASAAAANR